MWPWQRNGEQPNHILIRRLLALSSIGHACLLLFLFVFYHDDATNLSRDVIAVLLDADVTIVRVPLSKVVNKTVPIVGSGKKAAVQPAVKTPEKKSPPPATGLVKPKVQPKAQSKVKKETPKIKPKPEVKPKKEAPKPKESEPVKMAKPELKKQEVKKEEPKKEVIKEESIPQQKIALQEAIAVQEQQVVDDNIVYVGQHEYAALEVQRQIQQEAERCWQAPPGIAADVGCQIVVHVNHDGTVRDITIVEQSGILMYDVRARQAVSQMEFPRGAWGKEVVVYFKQ